MEPCSIYLFIIAELFSNMSTFYCAMSELFFITAIIYTNTSTMTEKWYGLGWWDWIQISIHAILCAALFFLRCLMVVACIYFTYDVRSGRKISV